MIDLKNICRVYALRSQPVHALSDVTLRIARGEFIAIMGASGSGKSTLMNIIGCLDGPTSGTYILDDVQVEDYDEDALAAFRNRKLGFVFQQFNLLPRMTALENVMLPLVYAGVPYEQRLERATTMLRLVALGDRINHRPSELSGGQQQRVSIARALVNDPQVLLADEPTGALDSHTSSEIMTFLKELNDRGLTLVLVTHDQEVAGHARRVVRLRDGRIIDDSRN